MHRFTPEKKLEIVKRHYEQGESIRSLAMLMGLTHTTVVEWCNKYKKYGDDAFKMSGYKAYSDALKDAAVKYYLGGHGSIRETCSYFNIKANYQLQRWIKEYNERIGSSTLRGRRYMTKGRKTTFEERVLIVKDCIEKGRHIGDSAAEHEVSYSQMQRWVKAYEEKGIEGLVDRRGKAKAEEDMTELDKLRAENRLLKAQLRRKELETELLKKLDEIERRRF